LHFFLQRFEEKILCSSIFQKILIGREIQTKNIIVRIEKLRYFDSWIKSITSFQ
jgi:hypothetical protein